MFTALRRLHFLKGKPAAPWIEKGVPAAQKGIDWGFGD